MTEERALDPLSRQKIAIIGAGAGIGSALARSFYSQDVDLYLSANAHYDALVQELNATKQTSDDAIRRAFQANLEVKGVPAKLANEISDALKDDQQTDAPRLDALVVVSGIDLMKPENKALTFDERLAKAWSIDVAACATIARTLGALAAKSQRETKERGENRPTPSVVLFSWSGVKRGQEGETAQIYSTCKGAVAAFAKSLAQDLAPYARVNCVSPGWIQTTWGKIASEKINKRVEKESLAKRWGRAQEVVDVVKFLIAPTSEYVNAQNIDVDGGYSYLP